jgi:hypothetical protein
LQRINKRPPFGGEPHSGGSQLLMMVGVRYADMHAARLTGRHQNEARSAADDAWGRRQVLETIWVFGASGPEACGRAHAKLGEARRLVETQRPAEQRPAMIPLDHVDIDGPIQLLNEETIPASHVMLHLTPDHRVEFSPERRDFWDIHHDPCESIHEERHRRFGPSVLAHARERLDQFDQQRGRGQLLGVGQ